MARWAGPDAPDSRNALENVCGSRSRSRGRTSLRCQTLQPPTAVSSPDVAQPVVQPVFAALPELDPARPQRVAAPVGRQWNLIGIFRRELSHRALEHLARRQPATLPRGQRRDLRAPGPAPEVLERGGPAQAPHRPGPAHLVASLKPVEDDRCAIVAGQVTAFSAAVVRVEKEGTIVDALQ